ncbi:uncharacterized protein LOC124891315 [Capsicum annuum]|uniref:uncharacterized protein LOC124891315 n=1 Tax=Capsicum annuum TaxID=4072 RepID=UPI001FB05FFC|nr:uncharacterized protein LOC124891315 [Capsicum annuum]
MIYTLALRWFLLFLFFEDSIPQQQKFEVKKKNERRSRKVERERNRFLDGFPEIIDMSEPAINITKHFSAVHGSMHSSAGTANRRKSIADVVVLDDTSSSSDEDFVPSSSWWKNKSKTDVGGDSSDDHSEKDEAVQFSAQSPGMHVQSPALKKSQCSAQVLDKTKGEVHKLLMMPLNEVVLPENQSSLIAALPRYAASPHFSIEKARAVAELKKIFHPNSPIFSR